MRQWHRCVRVRDDLHALQQHSVRIRFIELLELLIMQPTCCLIKTPPMEKLWVTDSVTAMHFSAFAKIEQTQVWCCYKW